MTLLFDKNSIMDNRKVEYEQSIVRLGLDKANLEKDVGQVRQEIDELCDRRVLIEKDIEEKKKELIGTEENLEEIRKEIEEVIMKGGANVAVLKDNREGMEEGVSNKKLELVKLEGYLASIMEDIKVRSLNHLEFQRDEKIARSKLVEAKSELTTVMRELESIKEEVKSVYRTRKDVLDDLEVATRELQEVREIVLVLRAGNKEGLDIVASFEGERKRLQEKDDFLRRKEADLAIYENRLKKRMDEVGYNTKMTFI